MASTLLVVGIDDAAACCKVVITVVSWGISESMFTVLLISDCS